MRKKYIMYIRYLKKANKKALGVFFVILIGMVACFSMLAIFSPEDRRFAIGMGTFGLLIFAFIHIAGFYHYVKNKPHNDE